MENTFTYTARSATAPEKVVTFTLHDSSMSVELGVPLEHIERALASLEQEPKAQDGGETVETQNESRSDTMTGAYYALKPMAVSLMEKGGQPFNVADVTARAEDEGLDVTAWVRAKGLRLAPIRFAWDRVDNPEGAKAFAHQVRARHEAASQPGRFAGMMDYWLSWLAFGTLLLALFWPHKKRHRSEADVG